MLRPRPPSVRLVGQGAAGRRPAPPFGLAGWSDQGEAVVVQLLATDGAALGAAAVARQLPDRAGFEQPTLVAVLGAAARSRLPWWRLGFARRVAVAREPRCSALVMCGYVDVGAAVDPSTSADIAWGWSSRRA